MSAQWEISEAKSRVDELLTRARSGEEILLAEDGHPVVRVSPVQQSNGHRIFGEYSGKLHISDDFAAPLAPSDQADWE
jgi:antitoxin (DNA-binding transcriptional repressor) of toxin-antitoxin stability system